MGDHAGVVVDAVEALLALATAQRGKINFEGPHGRRYVGAQGVRNQRRPRNEHDTPPTVDAKSWTSSLPPALPPATEQE